MLGLRSCTFALAVSLLISQPLWGQEDVADASSEEIELAGKHQQRYFLIGAQHGIEPPAPGYALLLVLPGGGGSAEFNPFIRRIWKHAMPEGYLIAQLVAVPSERRNQIVWPTAKAKDAKQDFSTEQFIAAVVDDVKSRHPIDDSRIFALGWSSGGPAVYAATLTPGTPLRGAFVAMSVFHPAQLPPLVNAKELRYFLLQSPQDQVTRIHFARAAQVQLAKAGAQVELVEYEGGHGWRGDVFGNIRAGVQWLEGGR